MTQTSEVVETADGANPPGGDVKEADRRRTVERRWSIVGIVLVVLLANAASLLGIVNPDPINQVSGLGTHAQASLLPGGDNIDPNIGFTSQALGHRAALDWIHGQVPWWDPDEGVGAPLAGEMQSAALFPPVLFDLMPNGQVFFRVSLEILAGIGAYLLLRRFVRSNLAAFVGGAAFALNGAFSWLFHSAANPIAFLPFVILGYEHMRDGALSQRRKGWALFAIALSLSLYAGFPETAFIDGLFAVLWMGVRTIGIPRRSLPVLGASVAIGVVVAAMLSAPIAIAFVDYLPHGDLFGHAGTFAHASMSATTALPTQIMPYLFGPIFGFTNADPTGLTTFWGGIGGYLGISVTFLAVVGLTGRTHRGLRIAMALWVVLGLARMVGVGVAIDIVNLIPGASSTAFSRYAVGSWVLALLVLATLGLDQLLARSSSIRSVLVAGATTLLLCLWAWHVASPVLNALKSAENARSWAVASLWWAVFVVVGIVGLALLPNVVFGRSTRGIRRIGIAILVIVDVGAMFVVPQLSAPRQESIDTGPVSFLAGHLGQERFFTLGPLAPNYGSYFGLASLAVNDLPIPKTFDEYVNHHLDPNVAGYIFNGVNTADPSGPSAAEEFEQHLSDYEAMGVKYVVLPAGASLPLYRGSELKEVYHDGVTEIAELPDPAQLFSSVGGKCFVRTRAATEAVVDCQKPSTLVYRELSMPGWRASVNGSSVTPRPYGSLFQAIDLPAGTSTVRFEFLPPFANVGAVLLLLGVLALLAACPPVRRGCSLIMGTLRFRRRRTRRLDHAD